MDSRTCSILFNLDSVTKPRNVASKYYEFVSKIHDSQASANATKTYDSLKQTVKECYLTGSLKYGNNFVY